jgi:RNA polymerase sigma factor (sigma-70 family)
VLTLLKSWVRPDAFHAVLNERSVRWYNACLRITRDADLAADAVQEALLKAWNHRDEFRGEAALDSWIHRIALNAAIDLTRKRKRRAEDELDPESFEAGPASSAESQYVEQAFGKDLATAMQPPVDQGAADFPAQARRRLAARRSLRKPANAHRQREEQPVPRGPQTARRPASLARRP